ncbi:MAG: hypothetical protein MZV64_35920 [Ignavibacteriales bacterium]|nr:hypothetical protein [Ignavibacteriales bacterium]
MLFNLILRISEKEIASDLIPEGRADIIISVEPMESLTILTMAFRRWLACNKHNAFY